MVIMYIRGPLPPILQSRWVPDWFAAGWSLPAAVWGQTWVRAVHLLWLSKTKINKSDMKDTLDARSRGSPPPLHRFPLEPKEPDNTAITSPLMLQPRRPWKIIDTISSLPLSKLLPYLHLNTVMAATTNIFGSFDVINIMIDLDWPRENNYDWPNTFKEHNAFEEPNDQHRRYHHYLQEPDAGINLHSFLQSVRRGK